METGPAGQLDQNQSLSFTFKAVVCSAIRFKRVDKARDIKSN